MSHPHERIDLADLKRSRRQQHILLPSHRFPPQPVLGIL